MLVHKRIKELAAFASKDNQRPALKAICINGAEAVATDGSVLVITPIGSIAFTDEDYPASDPAQDITPYDGGLLSTDHVVKAVNNLPKKPRHPILEYVQVSAGNNKTTINSGLPPVQFTEPSLDGQYPDYKAMIPDYSAEPTIKFAFGACILKKICDAALRHGDRTTKQITFEISVTEQVVKTDEHGDAILDEGGNLIHEQQPISVLTRAMRFSIKDSNCTEVFHGLIMPLRISE